MLVLAQTLTGSPRPVTPASLLRDPGPPNRGLAWKAGATKVLKGHGVERLGFVAVYTYCGLERSSRSEMWLRLGDGDGDGDGAREVAGCNYSGLGRSSRSEMWLRLGLGLGAMHGSHCESCVEGQRATARAAYSSAVEY